MRSGKLIRFLESLAVVAGSASKDRNQRSLQVKIRKSSGGIKGFMLPTEMTNRSLDLWTLRLRNDLEMKIL